MGKLELFYIIAIVSLTVTWYHILLVL